MSVFASSSSSSSLAHIARGERKERQSASVSCTACLVLFHYTCHLAWRMQVNFTWWYQQSNLPCSCIQRSRDVRSLSKGRVKGEERGASGVSGVHLILHLCWHAVASLFLLFHHKCTWHVTSFGFPLKPAWLI